MIACILLAAGESTRFGSPKALAPVGNLTAIEHIQHTLLSAGIDRIIVVLGAHQSVIESQILPDSKIRTVVNPDYRLGQTSSVLTGLKLVSHEIRGLFLVPVDCPFIRVSTYRIIRDHAPSTITIPTYRGRKGHPPFLQSKLFQPLANLDIQTGVNELFQHHEDETLLLEIDDPGISATFNTPQELKNVKDQLNIV